MEFKDWPNSIPHWNDPEGEARAEGTCVEAGKVYSGSYSATDFLQDPNKAIFTLRLHLPPAKQNNQHCPTL